MTDHCRTSGTAGRLGGGSLGSEADHGPALLYVLFSRTETLVGSASSRLPWGSVGSWGRGQRGLIPLGVVWPGSRLLCSLDQGKGRFERMRWGKVHILLRVPGEEVLGKGQGSGLAAQILLALRSAAVIAKLSQDKWAAQ